MMPPKCCDGLEQEKTPAVCVEMVGRRERARFSGRDSVGRGSQRRWIGCQRRQEEHSRKQVFSKPQPSVKCRAASAQKGRIEVRLKACGIDPGKPKCQAGRPLRAWRRVLDLV